MFRTFGLLAVLALFFIASGCGSDSTPTFKVTEVKGKVTKGGQGLADAQVSLMYQGQGPKGFPGAGGKTDADGNFEVMTGPQKGVPAGTYTVVVNKMVGPDGKPPIVDPESPNDAGQAAASGGLTDAVPAPYNTADTSPTKITVTEGKPVTPAELTIAIP